MKIEQLARSEVMNAVITGEVEGIYICYRDLKTLSDMSIRRLGSISVDRLHAKLGDEKIGFIKITTEDDNESA